MVQKTVLKVNISCDKCKTNILKAVSGLQGVDKVEVDGAKGTITVTGDADPYEVTVKTRKAGKFAQVVSIGPPPPKPQEKKPEDKKPDQKAHQLTHPHGPFVCPLCERLFPVLPLTPWGQEQPSPHCNIF